MMRKKLNLIMFVISLALTAIVFAQQKPQNGGDENGGGGPALWVREDPVCTVTCQRIEYSIFPPYFIVVQELRAGHMTRCYAGGNEQCNAAPCNASC
ncbi:MAG: hypothetical protein Kow00108_01880 [Calditrichia bacterium]